METESNVIRKLEDILLVSVPPHLLDSEVLALRRQTLLEIRRHRCRWVLLDFSQVVICDSFFGRFIHSMAETSRLMGARIIVSGLQDAVIETLVELDFDLADVQAVLDLDDALALSHKIKQREAAVEDEAVAQSEDVSRSGDAPRSENASRSEAAPRSEEAGQFDIAARPRRQGAYIAPDDSGGVSLVSGPGPSGDPW